MRLERKNQEKDRTLLIERALTLVELIDRKPVMGVSIEDAKEALGGVCDKTARRWLHTATTILGLDTFHRDGRLIFRRIRPVYRS